MDSSVASRHVFVVAVVDGTRVDGRLRNQVEAGSALEVQEQRGRGAEMKTELMKIGSPLKFWNALRKYQTCELSYLTIPFKVRRRPQLSN